MADTRTSRNPTWWGTEHDSAWERTKEAFRRDWEQTKHDFGGNAPDLDQDVDDTVKQAVGSQTIPPPGQPTMDEDEDFDPDYDYDAYEPAYRFGYGARRQYGDRYPEWNEDLEDQLRADWESTYRGSDYEWNRYRSHVRRGWDYRG